jgi:hypothetical protein
MKKILKKIEEDFQKLLDDMPKAICPFCGKEMVDGKWQCYHTPRL